MLHCTLQIVFHIIVCDCVHCTCMFVFAMHVLQQYFASFKNLFSQPCLKCKRHLDILTRLPPTWRDFFTLQPYHQDCKLWGMATAVPPRLQAMSLATAISPRLQALSRSYSWPNHQDCKLWAKATAVPQRLQTTGWVIAGRVIIKTASDQLVLH